MALSNNTALPSSFPDGANARQRTEPSCENPRIFLRSATSQTELRKTVQSRQPYYIRTRPNSARQLDQPYEFAVEVVVDWDRLEPGTDIHAVVRDQVASVTPLTWRMTADTDWAPRAADGG